VRRRVRLVALPIVAATVLAIGASFFIAQALAALHNRAVFGTFDTAGAPPRVDYCGRRYYPGSNVDTLAQVNAFLASNKLYGITRIDTAPSGMPIVANVMSADLRARYHTSVCTMSLWLQTGPDSYLGYGLSGGP
jgi:hypothetical protein